MQQFILERLLTPVRQGFSYGIRHVFLCGSMNFESQFIESQRKTCHILYENPCRTRTGVRNLPIVECQIAAYFTVHLLNVQDLKLLCCPINVLKNQEHPTLLKPSLIFCSFHILKPVLKNNIILLSFFPSCSETCAFTATKPSLLKVS